MTRRTRARYIALGASALFVLVLALITPPFGAPHEIIIKIREGTTVGQTALLLQEKKVVRFPHVFEVLVRILGPRHGVIAGEYTFMRPQSAFSVAWRFAYGDFKTTAVRVTIREGMAASEIAVLLEQKLAAFDMLAFLGTAKDKEGYLFPDTYFFLPHEDTQDVLAILEDNFNAQTSTPSFRQGLERFGKPLEQVVIMASILEKEAADTADRRIIAGILWNRLAVGMPLQVDAVFPYIIGIASHNLTRADLTVASPYNTYVNKGLPPGPIGNPGLDSLVAAMTPVKTEYVYYLSDRRGEFHYCVTHECHVANKQRYLRN